MVYVIQVCRQLSSRIRMERRETSECSWFYYKEIFHDARSHERKKVLRILPYIYLYHTFSFMCSFVYGFSYGIYYMKLIYKTVLSSIFVNHSSGMLPLLVSL
jgi:hypothetical protein